MCNMYVFCENNCSNTFSYILFESKARTSKSQPLSFFSRNISLRNSQKNHTATMTCSFRWLVSPQNTARTNIFSIQLPAWWLCIVLGV